MLLQKNKMDTKMHKNQILTALKKISQNYKILLFGFLIIAFLQIQCVGSLSKEYPQKRYYLITADKTQFGKLNKKFHYVRVNKFKISSIYEGKSFVYKQTDVSFDSDYYNEFLVFPVSNITEIFNQWVPEVELGTIPPNIFENEKLHFLSGQVSSLFGDFTDTKNPKAILEIDIYIQRASDSGIIFKKKYKQTTKLEKPQAEDLVKGWNICMTQILLSLEKDIRKL
jgi:cholesterol transport system auxiliary component